MSRARDILKDALDNASARPSADMSIEQYLMTPESMSRQVELLDGTFRDKKVLFLGDDDHISVMLGKHLNVHPVVLEYDSRIRTSLENQYRKFDIQNYRIDEYDAREPLPKEVRTDAFYINPPYSSKNNGKGAKVWISRTANAVPEGSTSVLVYPIDENLPWTLSCANEILKYAYDCGLAVINIDKDIHTYKHLPNDPGLLSSNIYLYKFRDVDPKEIGGLEGESLYR